MLSALAIATLLSGGSCALVEAPRIEARDGRFTLRDVIEVGCPALVETSDLIVTALPRGTNSVLVSRDALASLIRRRAPSITIEIPINRGHEAIALWRSENTDLSPGLLCFELAHAVAPGAALTRRDVTIAPCTSERTPLPLTYDARHAVVRATGPGDAGHYLGPLVDLPEDLIEQGEALQLRISVGPVTIARDVVAAQLAHADDTIFVRDADGNVFTARSTDIDEAQP